MNREDIIKLAREVGYPLVEYEGTPYIPPLLAVLLETVAAAQKQWVGLTDDEVNEIYTSVEIEVNEHWDKGGTTKMFPLTLYKAIEAKLKEKNSV
jgi:hypothetical protein